MRSVMMTSLALLLLSATSLLVHSQQLDSVANPFTADSTASSNRTDEGSDLDEATWRRVLLLNPTDSAAHYQLANALAGRGKTEAAEAAYRKAIEYDPTNADAYERLGILLYTTDRGEAALTALKEAIRLDPDSLEANRTYAFVLLEISDYAAAATAFAQLIRLSPDDPQLDYFYYSMGQMLYGTDEFGRAQAAYREALRLNPAYDEARKSLAQLLYRQGDVEAAIAIDQKVNYYMGDDFRIYEQYAAAEVNYREAVRLNPDFAEAYIKLGVTLQDLGKMGEAEVFYKKAIQMVESNPQPGRPFVQYLYDSYSSLLKEQGRDSEADAIQQRSPSAQLH